MILLTNTIAQTIEPGDSVTFDEVILHSGCGECHRKGSGSVKLRCNGVYELHFSANIGGETAATAVQLTLISIHSLRAEGDSKYNQIPSVPHVYFIQKGTGI